MEQSKSGTEKEISSTKYIYMRKEKKPQIKIPSFYRKNLEKSEQIKLKTIREETIIKIRVEID